VQASTEAEAVVVLLRQERADNTVWETLYDRATEIAAANEIAYVMQESNTVPKTVVVV
jgi:hypothetical protein